MLGHQPANRPFACYTFVPIMPTSNKAGPRAGARRMCESRPAFQAVTRAVGVHGRTSVLSAPHLRLCGSFTLRRRYIQVEVLLTSYSRRALPCFMHASVRRRLLLPVALACSCSRHSPHRGCGFAGGYTTTFQAFIMSEPFRPKFAVPERHKHTPVQFAVQSVCPVLTVLTPFSRVLTLRLL